MQTSEPDFTVCHIFSLLIQPLAVNSHPTGHVVPPEKVHEKLFVGSSRDFKKPSQPAVKRYNKTPSAENIAKLENKLVRKEWKLRKRLAAQGIDYDFPGFVSEQTASCICGGGRKECDASASVKSSFHFYTIC